ncbi:MAG: amino acid permease [Bacteroidetes bacterium]|nr:amino acid permease [Bacteroidota bacterium]
MEVKRKLTLSDAVLIVSGSMIGSGIFIVSAEMTRTISGPGWLLLLWVISGVITVFAALSYGELAGMFPHAGGQYVYLKEAFNPLVGFVYGWTLFLVVQSGTIAAVAVAFAKFAGVLYEPFGEKNILLDLGWYQLSAAQVVGVISILLLTLINIRGIHYGKLVARIFSSTKLIALLGLILLGLICSRNAEVWRNNWSDMWSTIAWSKDGSGQWSWKELSSMGIVTALGAALVGSLFSSDAWNNVTFISGDIENPKRNIPLSLLFGTLIVTILYVLTNMAYLSVLPVAGDPDGTTVTAQGIQFAANDRVGTAAATMIFGSTATIIMAVLIMISTFSCNNGIVLSSVRVYQAMARDGLFFRNMKEDNKNGVPGFALWIQFIWAALLTLSGKYGPLLDYVMFGVMLFYILTIAGLFVLRRTQPDAERPYKAFGYPVIPIAYILFAALFCINLLCTKPENSIPGLIIILAGIPVYFIWRRVNSTIVTGRQE